MPHETRALQKAERVKHQMLDSPLPLEEHVFRVPPDALQEAEESQTADALRVPPDAQLRVCV
jgi:hypothetical protein